MGQHPGHRLRRPGPRPLLPGTVKDDHPYNEATFSPGPGAGDAAPSPPAPAASPLTWSGTPSAARPLSASITGDAAAKGYLSWRLTGVPLKPPADSDEGLKIRRSYSSLAAATTQPTTTSALQTLHRGDIVEVQITIESATSLSNVVIEDLLPAGLEIENPRLSNAQVARYRTTPKPTFPANLGANPFSVGEIVIIPLPPNANATPDPFASSPAVPLQQLSPNALDVRDDRLVLMADLPAGASSYTYLARAVTPGTYIIPPVRGECMYDISIHSLGSGGAHLQITPEPPPTKVAAR